MWMLSSSSRLGWNKVSVALFPLSGPVQTAPRAEIFCPEWLVDKAEALFDIHYVTDNQGLYTTFNKGPQAGSVSSNADLYNTMFDVIYDKALRVKVTWMPSHLTDKDERPAFVSSVDLKGNSYADEECMLAATSARLPLNVTAPIIYYYTLVRRIQKRLATIVGYFLES